MKVNPRRIPRTQSDVDRAREQGRNEGITGALTIFLYTLKDKFGASDDELKEFADAFNYVLDSITKGYVTEADLRTVVKVEYGYVLEVKNPPCEGKSQDGSNK